MAIFFVRATTIGVAQGNILSAVSYRSGEKMYRSKTEERFNYDRKQGILYTNLISPNHFPWWTKKRSDLWNAVDKNEDRSNSRFARELVLALPHELTFERNVQLVEEYVRENLIPMGFCCDIAIHTPETRKRNYLRDRDGSFYEDSRNIHAHVLMTDRRSDSNGTENNAGRIIRII